MNRADFDSAIPWFESWRPSHPVLVLRDFSIGDSKSPRVGPIPGLRDGLCVADLSTDASLARLSSPANFRVSFSGCTCRVSESFTRIVGPLAAYIAVGILPEERDLVDLFGDATAATRTECRCG